MTREPAFLLQQLVATPSVTPREKNGPAETRMAEAVAAWLREAGLADAVRQVGYPGTLRGVNYGTDASKCARAGIPAVVFGPGSIRQAHAAEEYIELRQLEAAAAILVQAIRKLA